MQSKGKRRYYYSNIVIEGIDSPMYHS